MYTGIRHARVSATMLFERARLLIELRVAAVGEHDHQIAGRVHEVEGLEQLRRLIDTLDDRRAPVGESAPLARIADQPRAQQDVLVVVRERRDDVGVVAELDERHEVAIGPVHPAPDELLGRGNRGEERRFTLPLRADSNLITMLVEPSTSSAIRRPGYDTSSRANPVCGSASATAKNGMPARNSNSGR